MSKKQIHKLLLETVEEEIPTHSVDLWLQVQTRLPQTAEKTKQSTFKLALQAVVILMAGIAALMLTPQGRSLAQEIIHYFERADADLYPIPSEVVAAVTSQAALVETQTPDPKSIFTAKEEVVAIEQQLGFDILEPAWLPEVLTFSGASADLENGIPYQFFSYSSYLDPDGTNKSNGLRIQQEPLELTKECELCGSVGASANVIPVYIGSSQGEYVTGVWKFTEAGAVWESDPYMQIMRWQQDGMAFEMMYMGPPEDVTMEDMITIAESLQ